MVLRGQFLGPEVTLLRLPKSVNCSEKYSLLIVIFLMLAMSCSDDWGLCLELSAAISRFVCRERHPAGGVGTRKWNFDGRYFKGRETICQGINFDRPFLNSTVHFGKSDRAFLLRRVQDCILSSKSACRANFLKSTFPGFPLLKSLSPAVGGFYCYLQYLLIDGDLLTLYFSNEFFDALPIHVFQRAPQGWDEVLVDSMDLGDDVQFRLVKSHGVTAALKMLDIEQRFAHLASGESIEVCPEANRITSIIADALLKSGGLFLAVDYGGFQPAKNSLRVCS